MHGSKARLLLGQMGGKGVHCDIARAPDIEEEERLDPLRCFSAKVGTGGVDRPLVLNSKADAVGDERELSK
jgi:hypothetical protein